MKNHNLRLSIVFIFMITILILISYSLNNIPIRIFDDGFIELINTISNAFLANINKQNILLGFLATYASVLIAIFLILAPFLVFEILFIFIHSKLYAIHSKVNRLFFLLLNFSPLFFMILLINTGLIFKSKILVDMLLPLLISFVMLAISSIVVFIFKKQKVQ